MLRKIAHALIFAIPSVVSADVYERHSQKLNDTEMNLRATVYPTQGCSIDNLSRDLSSIRIIDFPVEHEVLVTCSGGGDFNLIIEDDDKHFSVLPEESPDVFIDNERCLDNQQMNCVVVGKNDGLQKRILMEISPRGMEGGRELLGSYEISVPLTLKTVLN